MQPVSSVPILGDLQAVIQTLTVQDQEEEMLQQTQEHTTEGEVVRTAETAETAAETTLESEETATRTHSHP